MTPPVTELTFAERLKTARLEAGLTNRQIAVALDVPESSLSRWQNGGHEPRWQTVVRLAEVLGKPVSYFLDEAAA